VPNQFDNIAELGLLAADYLLLPVELTADWRRAGRDRSVDHRGGPLHESKSHSSRRPRFGILPAGRPGGSGLSAKERLILHEYEEVLAKAGITLFKTIMFRSSTTVEEGPARR